MKAIISRSLWNECIFALDTALACLPTSVIEYFFLLWQVPNKVFAALNNKKYFYIPEAVFVKCISTSFAYWTIIKEKTFLFKQRRLSFRLTTSPCNLLSVITLLCSTNVVNKQIRSSYSTSFRFCIK